MVPCTSADDVGFGGVEAGCGLCVQGAVEEGCEACSGSRAEDRTRKREESFAGHDGMFFQAFEDV